jgi:two-component system sensor histidine kinase DesK
MSRMTARLSSETPSPVSRPGVELAYLVFVFLPLLFWPEHPWRAVWTSLLAVALFLPLFFAFHRDPQARRWIVLPVAGLGLALIPFNPGGNAFVIYAVAMAGVALRPRSAIAFAAVLLLAMVGEIFLVMPNLGLALGYTLMIVVIAALVLTGVLVARERERRNAELKLSQEEIARLAAMAGTRCRWWP